MNLDDKIDKEHLRLEGIIRDNAEELSWLHLSPEGYFSYLNENETVRKQIRQKIIGNAKLSFDEYEHKKPPTS